MGISETRASGRWGRRATPPDGPPAAFSSEVLERTRRAPRSDPKRPGSAQFDLPPVRGYASCWSEQSGAFECHSWATPDRASLPPPNVLSRELDEELEREEIGYSFLTSPFLECSGPSNHSRSLGRARDRIEDYLAGLRKSDPTLEVSRCRCMPGIC